MIEYLHDAIRATAGEPITLAARITDENGTPVVAQCHLNFYNDTEQIGHYSGSLVNGVWSFTIPAEATKGIKGRYWYCVCDVEHTKLNFKQPIYLV